MVTADAVHTNKGVKISIPHMTTYYIVDAIRKKYKAILIKFTYKIRVNVSQKS